MVSIFCLVMLTQVPSPSRDSCLGAKQRAEGVTGHSGWLGSSTCVEEVEEAEGGGMGWAESSGLLAVMKEVWGERRVRLVK